MTETPQKTQEGAVPAQTGASGLILPAQDKAPEFKMPTLEKGPASFFDSETGNYWIGIPLSKVEPFVVSLILDAEKYKTWERQMMIVKSAQENRPKIIRSVQESTARLKNFVVSKLRR